MTGKGEDLVQCLTSENQKQLMSWQVSEETNSRYLIAGSLWKRFISLKVHHVY